MVDTRMTMINILVYKSVSIPFKLWTENIQAGGTQGESETHGEHGEEPRWHRHCDESDEVVECARYDSEKQDESLCKECSPGRGRVAQDCRIKIWGGMRQGGRKGWYVWYGRGQRWGHSHGSIESLAFEGKYEVWWGTDRNVGESAGYYYHPMMDPVMWYEDD